MTISFRHIIAVPLAVSCCLLASMLFIAPRAAVAAESDFVSRQIEMEMGEVRAAADDPLGGYEGQLEYDPDLVPGAAEIAIGEAVEIALANNLDLKAAVYASRSTAAALRSSYGLYDPVLQARYGTGRLQQETNTTILTAPKEIDTDFNAGELSLTQQIPTGAELVIASDVLNEDEQITPPPINPSYTGQIGLSLTQPLLKGFGRTVTEEAIILAAKDQQVSLQDLRNSAFLLVARVRDAYYDVLQARYELAFRTRSVALSKRIVRENNARVKAGILAPVESLEADVGLQLRERILLEARRQFDDSVDRFNLLLNAEPGRYVPAVALADVPISPDVEKDLEKAFLSRPDVIARMIEIEKLRVRRDIDRNSLFPQLDLKAAYGHNGLADSLDGVVDDFRDGDQESWEVGMQFSYPLGSRESRNELKKTDIALKQQRALLSQLKSEIRNEVRASIRAFEVSRKQAEVARRGHELAKEKLRILLKQLDVGISSTRNVLDGEEDLASARSDQILAMANYFRSATEYLRVTGRLLDDSAVVFRGDFGPDSDGQLFEIER